MIRNSVYFFVVLALIAVAGFWPSYFSRIHEETEFRVHLHGAAMSTWLLMLIGQSYLIRSDRGALHRLVGTVSYLLVPLIVFSALTLHRFRLQASVEDLPPELLSASVYGTLGLVGVFVVAVHAGDLSQTDATAPHALHGMHRSALDRSDRRPPSLAITSASITRWRR